MRARIVHRTGGEGSWFTAVVDVRVVRTVKRKSPAHHCSPFSTLLRQTDKIKKRLRIVQSASSEAW
jgi:hypothetical protein